MSPASDGTVYGIAGSAVLQYMGQETGWIDTGCPEALVAISAGSASAVWGLDAAGHVYRFEGGTTWKETAGSLAAVSVAADNQVWGIDLAQNVACLYTGDDWFDTPIQVTQISAGGAVNVWAPVSYTHLTLPTILRV